MAAPFHKGYKQMPPQYLKALKKYIDKFKAQGFIRQSNSPAAAPILIIEKLYGGLRV
ncbi:hypothetical protein KEM56_002923, partial [Ascosphaera pollenicola]